MQLVGDYFEQLIGGAISDYLEQLIGGAISDYLANIERLRRMLHRKEITLVSRALK